MKDQSNAQDAEDLVDTAKNALSDSIDLEQPGWKNQIGSVIIMMVEVAGYTSTSWPDVCFSTVLTLHGYGHITEMDLDDPSVYPHMYRNKDGAWMYFIVQALLKFITINQANRLRGKLKISGFLILHSKFY